MTYLAFALGGFVVGLGFSAIYAVIYALSGGLAAVDGSVISMPAAAGVYTATGVAGGVVAAVFRNVYGSKAWAGVAGVFSLTPMSVAGAYLYYGSIGQIDWLGVVVITILIGAPLGIAIGREVKEFQGFR
ncbi:MAG: hypothetical protein ACOC5M_01645 [Chloroflexota bacterium]